MSALLPLENKWGTRSDWTLQAKNRDGTVPTQFDGTEALTVKVSISQGSAAVFTTTATWADFTVAKVAIVVTAAQSALLNAGQVYQLEVICTPSGDDPDCILWVTLTSLPSAGSGGILLRSLVELDEAINVLSFLSTQQQDILGQALESATEAIEAYCRWKLVLTTFDKLYRPGRTRKIYLDTRHVAIMTAPLSWGLDYAGTIVNNSGANQLASISMQPASAYSNAVTSITLNSTASGVVAAPIVLPLATYTTFGALLTAVSAAGAGWQGSATTSQYSLWPTSRLLYQAGPVNAVGSSPNTTNGNQIPLPIYSTDMVNYDVDYERGIIELTQNLPEAYRYGDRAFGVGYGSVWAGSNDPRQANVRAQYRAGYAVAQSDLDLGYRPVPGTLKTACLMTANAILEAAPLSGPVQSQSVTGRSYTLRGDASVVPHEARVLLTREINRRFGGWGTR
jgi:hypothetical protein